VAEVTLGDYAGYIFLEMIRAREMADAYSRAVAERYAADEVMQHFSVPRFRVPKMELTIPVLIAGARFRQTVRLDLPEDEFVTAMDRRAGDVRTRVEVTRGILPRSLAVSPRSTSGSATVERLARDFHAQLAENPDPLRPDTIVTNMWRQIFRAVLGEERILKFYSESDPHHDLLIQTTKEVLAFVRSRTVVDSTAIESLLINPETQIVKDGSSDSSVFTIAAELLEEGFYLRSVRDEETNETSTIVDFE
jgi:hypothetical protein